MIPHPELAAALARLEQVGERGIAALQALAAAHDTKEDR